jgi:hypothetical protein
VSRERGKTPEQDTDAAMASTAEVKAVVEDVQRAHRGRVRWGIGKHTAELALRALDRRAPRKPRSSKVRRRKRYKRLL